jgi:Ion channel
METRVYPEFYSMRFAVAAISLFCIAILLFDVFEVMLLPRRVRRRARLVRIFFRSTWAAWSNVALRFSPGNGRETILSFYGPFSMVLLIAFWVSALIVGFGCLQWAIEGSFPLTRELYLSGTTFFTLGYGDVIPQMPVSKLVAIWESGTGFGFIAVTIGYLPVLYQMYSRRETHVIQLDARAGSPPSAITLLTRHAEGQGIENLHQLLRSWEGWASEMVESHLSYPMLSYYRSQHDNQSWLAAMCAILDSCALLLVGMRDIQTFPAKMAFATSRLALIELSRVFEIQHRTQAAARHPPLDFKAVSDELGKAGLFFSDNDAEEKLTAFRATYEPFLVGLSEYLLLPLPSWLPTESLDNWQNSPRGRRAKQLVDKAAARPN